MFLVKVARDRKKQPISSKSWGFGKSPLISGKSMLVKYVVTLHKDLLYSIFQWNSRFCRSDPMEKNKCKVETSWRNLQFVNSFGKVHTSPKDARSTGSQPFIVACCGTHALLHRSQVPYGAGGNDHSELACFCLFLSPLSLFDKDNRTYK